MTKIHKIPIGELECNIQWDGLKYVFFEDKVSDIEGIWDLIMIEGARIIIEQKYQKLTGGPDISLPFIKPLYVQNKENEFFKLCELNDYMIDIPGTTASHQSIKDDIRLNDYEHEVVSKMLSDHFHESLKYGKKFDDRDPYCFYPTRDLPEDCAIGVRPQALIDFIHRLADDKSKKDMPLYYLRERSLLNIISILLSIIVGVNKDKQFSKDIELKKFIAENFKGNYGVKNTNAARIFAKARKSLKVDSDKDALVSEDPDSDEFDFDDA